MITSFNEMTYCFNDFNFSTLVDRLHYKALHQPDQLALTFMQDGETQEVSLTYQELDRQARGLAAHLQSLGVSGERSLLLYPPGMEFIVAFLGCLYAGIIAIPAYPPRPNQSLSRLQAIVADAQATIALTTTTVLSNLERQLTQSPDLKAIHWLATDKIASDSAQAWQKPALCGNTLAFLQYTSGSTGTPKGVMVSHANLLHNERMIQQGMQHTEKTIHVSWLPLFHDMGLIGNMLQALYLGTPYIFMSPVAFLQRPWRWLQAISRYKATTSGGPNFAYDLCVRKIAPEQRATLDLSSWEVAFNGSEPVRVETLERFTAAFSQCGFRASAFYPCYGMAEATLIVSGGLKTALPVFKAFQKDALEQNRLVSDCQENDGARTLVGCGQTLLEQRIIIAHPETLTRCSPDEVGEIWVSGPNVAQGYWNRLEATERNFRAYLADTAEGPFLRTGDLGFLQDGELFITGRLKDLIIIRGRNHYPQDIELTVEQSHPAVRSGCCAAFSVEVKNEEQLVVALEVERHYLRNLDVDAVVRAVRQAVLKQHELQVHAVLLLKPASIPKTSSGKIQRQGCRTGFLKDSLSVVSVWKSHHTVDAEQPKDSESWVSPTNLNNGNSMNGSNAYTNPRITTNSITADSVKTEDASGERADGLIKWLRTYANERINSRMIDERRCIPPYIVLDFGNRGLLAMQVPETYGGIALNNRDTLRVFEQLAAVDLTLASFVGVNNALGIRPIMNYASSAVRDNILPSIAQGRELAAYAITEPGAGSNPRAISATATPDGCGGWRLNGEKVFIGSGSWAGFINVFVQLLDTNNQSLGITGFVVRQETPGLRQGPEALTMGVRGMVQNSVYLNNVAVGPDDLLSFPGGGMQVAQDAMMFGRLGLGAISVGGMKRCAQLMLRYAGRRSVATGRLLDNPVTLTRLSELTAAIATVETLITRIAELLDNGHVVPVEAYIACKTSGPEFLWKAADHLVQLLGGRGYIEMNIAPQILRDARLLRIFEGPTETLNMFLGSNVLHTGEELHHFLCNTLGAQAVSKSLKIAAARINERCSGSKASFCDHPFALRWASMLIGEVATFAILLAAVQNAFERSPSERLRRAVEWARLHFEQKLNQALSGTPADSVLSSANAITDQISDYVTAIGDLEQTLAGENHEIDELLLRQSSSEASSVLNSNYVSETERVPHTQIATLPIETSTKSEVSRSSVSAAMHTTETIQNWIVDWLSRELRLSAKLIDTRKPFSDYGLDSVTAVTLSADLEGWLGRTLSSTLAYEYPTIESLVHHLAAETGEPERISATQSYQSSNYKEVDQILMELEQLSEVEAQLALSKGTK